MKKALFVSALALSGSAFASQEIPITGAYAPVYGYDNNDAVEVVFEGDLPNACYTIAKDVVTVDEKKKTIHVGVLVNRLKDGVCAEGDANLPPQALALVHFERNVTVGVLPEGNYNIEYITAQGPRTRLLNVGVAAVTSSVDSNRYAMISNAFVAKQVEAGQTFFEVRLTGAVGSSCTFLKDIQITQEDDVFVVLPITETLNEMCMTVEVPFYKVVQVKTPISGRYLLHTRSVGGGSKNSLFSVR